MEPGDIDRVLTGCAADCRIDRQNWPPDLVIWPKAFRSGRASSAIHAALAQWLGQAGRAWQLSGWSDDIRAVNQSQGIGGFRDLGEGHWVIIFGGATRAWSLAECRANKDPAAVLEFLHQHGHSLWVSADADEQSWRICLAQDHG